jgi:hypothetical protein
MRTFTEKPKEPQQGTSAKPTLPSRTHRRQSYAVNSIFHLQRTIGNQAVQRLLEHKAEELKARSATTISTRFAHDLSQIPVHHRSSEIVQAKLAVSSPADIYEQEADSLSEQVMNMSASGLRTPVLAEVCAPNVRQCNWARNMSLCGRSASARAT